MRRQGRQTAGDTGHDKATVDGAEVTDRRHQAHKRSEKDDRPGHEGRIDEDEQRRRDQAEPDAGGRLHQRSRHHGECREDKGEHVAVQKGRRADQELSTSVGGAVPISGTAASNSRV